MEELSHFYRMTEQSAEYLVRVVARKTSADITGEPGSALSQLRAAGDRDTTDRVITGHI